MKSHYLQVTVQGDTIVITVNGAIALKTIDPSPLPPGGVGFDVSGPGSASFKLLAVHGR